MTIARVNAVGWAAFEKLTSTQANGLDINTTYALDKRTGQTDTLESVVTASGAGRVIPTHATGANAATNYTAAGGNTVLRIPSTLTANRTYTFQNTNASAGDAIHIYSDAALTRTVTIADHSGDTLCKIGSSPSLDDSFDARGCVLRHNGTDWFVESLSYERHELPSRMAQLGVAMIRSVDSTVADYGGICWDSKNKRVYYCGGTDVVGYSEKAGSTPNDDVVPIGQQNTLRCRDIAASDTGIVVCTTNSTKIYTQPDASTFTRYDVLLAGTTDAVVTYDPVSARFLILGASSTVARLYYSSNGVAWTNYGAPPNIGANTTTRSIGTNGLGRVVAASANTANGNVHFNYTDDGGTTWSAGSTVALAATGYDPTHILNKIAYNDVREEWALAVGFSGTTEILTSQDGITWAVAFSSSSASDPEINSLVSVNGLWVGIGHNDHEVMISRDGFTSVQYVGEKLDVTLAVGAAALCAGASHMFCFSESRIFHAPILGRGLSNLT